MTIGSWTTSAPSASAYHSIAARLSLTHRYGVSSLISPPEGTCRHASVRRMRFSVNVPCFGDFADPRAVARVATAAEDAGWDGLFVWDHLVHGFHDDRPFGDPWM